MKIEFRNIRNRELIVTEQSNDLQNLLPVISQKGMSINICTKDNVKFFGQVDHCELNINEKYKEDVFIIYIGGLATFTEGSKRSESHK